jgi:hypothetical protein
VAEVAAATVAIATPVAAPARRRGRPAAVAAAPVTASPDVTEPIAPAGEVDDDEAVIDESRPLAHVRQAARTAPAPTAIEVAEAAPVEDPATGAFAAAVAARQTKKKRSKPAVAETPVAPQPAAPAAATATGAAAGTAARTFAKGPPKGVERAKITYRQVRISSEPDVVQSVELGRLDRGDEVEIVESFEGFLRVRTPDGVTGWIVRHTIA